MPDEHESRPAESGAASITTQGAHHYIAGLRRRRAAAHRVEPIECGCTDPWTCRHYDRPERSERTADGYCAAAAHLIGVGLLPSPNIPAMRTMWRLDVEKRELALYIAERWEVSA